MDGEASLETLAEVAIALAGFGSLLVVLRRSPTSPWSEGEGADLLVVVGGSLLVLFFSLLPLPLFHLGLPAERAWRASSLLFALALLLAYAVIFRRRRMLERLGIHASSPRLSAALAQLPLLLVAALGLQATGGLAGSGVGVYLLALVLLLAGSAFPLVSMVMSVGVGSQADAGGGAGDVRGAIPQLFVSDLRASLEFFATRLGFSVVSAFGDPPFYALLARGAARLNLRHVDAPVIDAGARERESLLSAYLPVEDVAALYAELESAGVDFHQPLRTQDWGTQDFVVRDPDGNLLCFASEPASADDANPAGLP